LKPFSLAWSVSCFKCFKFPIQLLAQHPCNSLSLLSYFMLCMVAEEEKRRESQPNLFKKSAAEEKRSKIFAALNPEKLFYESQREKQENSEETVQVGTPHGADDSAMP